MKKLVIASMLFIAGLFFVTGTADAAPVTISLDGLWDWGTIYGKVGPTWTPLNPNPYTGVTSGNTLTDGVVGVADGTEDTYGIARVNQIIQGGNVLFDRATAASELTVFFYGFDDIYLKGDLSIARLLASGGHAAIYEDFAKNLNAANPPGPESVSGGGGRADGDPTSFSTVTDGTKVLDLTPKVIVDPVTGASYTLENQFSFNTLSGFGSVLFDVTGGTWASAWDTNTQDLGSDIKFNFSSFPNTTGSSWTVWGVGNATGDIVPEPASMAIFGIGLLGLGTLRRRKKAV